MSPCIPLTYVRRPTLPCNRCGNIIPDLRSEPGSGEIGAYCRQCGGFIRYLPQTGFNVQVLMRHRAADAGEPMVLQFPGPKPPPNQRGHNVVSATSRQVMPDV